MKEFSFKKYENDRDESVFFCNDEGVVEGDYVLASEAQERERVLREALESIVEDHDAHCEHHVNVSQHSYDLVAIAVTALAQK